MDPFSFGGHIFVVILPNVMISMAMGEPKNGAQVFFGPYYEKNED
jgi:hypothetical protein